MEGLVTRIKVRGYHTDSLGHVNNARYLEFYEANRWDLYDRAMNQTQWAKKGLATVIVNININYHRPVFLGSTIEIRSHLERVGSRSAALRQKIFLADSDQLVSDALVTFVIAGKDGKALNMDADVEEIREFLSIMKAMSAPNDKLSNSETPVNAG